MKKIFLVFLTLIVLFCTAFTSQSSGLAAPAANKTSGVYYVSSTLVVTLKAAPGAVIVFTTDGSDPKATLDIYGNLKISVGKQYKDGISFTKTSTLKAIALKKYFLVSPVATYKYEVFNQKTLEQSVKDKFSKFYYRSYTRDVSYKAKDGSKGTLPRLLSSGYINCTWLTFTRLKYNTGRELLFTKAGGLSGKYWFEKVVASSKDKYGGANGLEALIKDKNNRPIYNVIVVFPKNGSSSEYGHVMLIDAIINGKIFCSDNRSPDKLVVYNSVAEFKKAYSSSNGTIIGVIYVGP